MTLSLSPLKKLSKGASDRIGTLGLMDSDILAEDRMAA